MPLEGGDQSSQSWGQGPVLHHHKPRGISASSSESEMGVPFPLQEAAHWSARSRIPRSRTKQPFFSHPQLPLSGQLASPLAPSGGRQQARPLQTSSRRRHRRLKRVAISAPGCNATGKGSACPPKQCAYITGTRVTNTYSTAERVCAHLSMLLSSLPELAGHGPRCHAKPGSGRKRMQTGVT